MKIKTIRKSWKISHNYNSFENEFEAELDENDDIEICMAELKMQCRKHCEKDRKEFELETANAGKEFKIPMD